jgi:hypothetical protein
MNTLLALLSILAWNDPEAGDRLALTQKITLGPASFVAGTSLRLEEKEPLAVPGAPLMYLRLTEEKCEHPEWESEMEIVTPAGNEEASAVGVQLSKDCNWEIYIEQKDMLTPSFFAAALK